MLFRTIIEKCCKFTTFFSKISVISLFLIFFTYSCSWFGSKDSKNKEEEIVKEERFEPNVFKRAERTVKDQGSIFSSGKRNSEAGISGNNNVIWKASLDSLSDIPLIQANYASGMIITDWYSGNISSKETIKISIVFVSDVIAVSSFKVNSFKKICESDNSCKIEKLPDKFNETVKNKIINRAKELSLSNKK